ncbi:hypothetical protein J2M53_14485 [Arthrobacter sp. zg-ZUI100]|nr:hypothetical protein [Arthrobacter jiangjiafuii]
MLLPLEVTYEDHTVDIAENRILRAALRRLLGLKHVIARYGNGSRTWSASSTASGTCAPAHAARAVAGNARYVPALRLAEIILRHSVVDTAAGGSRMASFAVNMAKVFEDFVEVALGEAVI